jgi:hypothetical protein
MRDPRLVATICSNRAPELVRPSLRAAVEQAESIGAPVPLLVASGGGERRQTELERLAAEMGARPLRAGAGLSVARNRAVAEVGEGEVVAFLDDDAIPHPDWLQRLRARWAGAPAGTACIGGAIEPWLSAAAPPWFSERVWASYSLLDRGPGLIELSPAAGEDVWGANVSFLAGAVREAGGFDPARGPWAGVPLFGDESELERRLEAAGMKVFYAGDVKVAHVIDAERLTLRGLARRERWRGFSLVELGLRRPAGALARAPKAALGLAAATVRGDRPRVGERRARLARELGVATAPLLRRRLRRRGWPG